MHNATILSYQQAFEPEQARIGAEVARDWVWPYAYDVAGLERLRTQPGFDPETRLYAFVNETMVGYVVATLAPDAEGKPPSAALDFPRVLPGHDGLAEVLIERSLDVLRRKGITHVTGRVTTMCPDDIELAGRAGFAITDWGYKVYYTYEMAWGKLEVDSTGAEEIDPETDLDACAVLAARWYGRPTTWCRALLAEWHAAGVVTHLAVREDGQMIAGCLAAPNEIRSSTAAIYYIFTPSEEHLVPLLARVVNACVDYGAHNVIADLINAQRPYEQVYQRLGFRKVADWARCEVTLS